MNILVVLLVISDLICLIFIASYILEWLSNKQYMNIVDAFDLNKSGIENKVVFGIILLFGAILAVITFVVFTSDIKNIKGKDMPGIETVAETDVPLVETDDIIVVKAFDLDENGEFIEYTVKKTKDTIGETLYEIYRNSEKISESPSSNFTEPIHEVSLNNLSNESIKIDLRDHKVDENIYNMNEDEVYSYIARSQKSDGCKLIRFIKSSKYIDAYLLQPDNSFIRLTSCDGEVIIKNIGKLDKASNSELGLNGLPDIIKYLT